MRPFILTNYNRNDLSRSCGDPSQNFGATFIKWRIPYDNRNDDDDEDEDDAAAALA